MNIDTYLRRGVGDSRQLDWLLRFSPGIEAAYERENGAERVNRLRNCILVGAALYALLAVGQFSLFSDFGFSVSLISILSFFAGCAAVYYFLNRLGGEKREFMVFLFLLAAVGASTVVYVNYSVTFTAHAFTKFVFLLAYANIFLVLRFRYALIFTLLTVATALGALYFSGAVATELTQVLAIQILTAGIFSLYANWQSERTRCLSYLSVFESREIADAARAMSVELKGLSLTDPLTGIANRRAFEGFLEDALADGLKVSILLVDVDYFKRFNDKYGHLAGDECLKKVAKAIDKVASDCHSNGIAARIGGEEFAIVVPEETTAGVLRVADAVIDAVRSLKVPHETRNDHSDIVTVSIGVANSDPLIGETRSALLRAADEALYEAKHRGRNRWEQAREDDGELVGFVA